MTILVTGGAGFIGSNFILDWLKQSEEPILNVDKLTYAGNLENLEALSSDSRHFFIRGDIRDKALMKGVLAEHKPRAMIHFAAESHVDRSIEGPEEFIQTNVLGTFYLLETALLYWKGLSLEDKEQFRFFHISTDEVFGTLLPEEAPFKESNPYAPNSPYSASKAASDHFVRAYHHTYGFPVLTTHCSNNYGPYHFPEKLIPLCIQNALHDKPLPIYGDGQQVRDWLFVNDHCSAIRCVLELGTPGEVYNIGGGNEKTNLEVIHLLCNILDEMCPRKEGRSFKDQITFVKDRLGHDRRYAVDAHKIEQTLGWKPKETFETGIRKTVLWYLENQEWVRRVTSGAYREEKQSIG